MWLINKNKNDLSVYFNLNGKPHEWRVFTNIPENQLRGIFDHWAARQVNESSFTIWEFCNYINDKNYMTGQVCLVSSDDFDLVLNT